MFLEDLVASSVYFLAVPRTGWVNCEPPSRMPKISYLRGTRWISRALSVVAHVALSGLV